MHSTFNLLACVDVSFRRKAILEILRLQDIYSMFPFPVFWRLLNCQPETMRHFRVINTQGKIDFYNCYGWVNMRVHYHEAISSDQAKKRKYSLDLLMPTRLNQVSTSGSQVFYSLLVTFQTLTLFYCRTQFVLCLSVL